MGNAALGNWLWLAAGGLAGCRAVQWHPFHPLGGCAKRPSLPT